MDIKIDDLSGVATKLVTHALTVAIEQGYQKASLKTGTQDFFLPARRLYEKLGFRYCGPFADYKPDPHSYFMTTDLTGVMPF